MENDWKIDTVFVCVCMEIGFNVWFAVNRFFENMLSKF